MSEYWRKFWNGISMDIDEQSQVGRTFRKTPISDDIFNKTVDWVADQMELDEKSSVLELCCGNGTWTIPLANRVRHVTAVDFSERLLYVLREKCVLQNIKNIDIMLQDVSAIDMQDYRFSTHVLLYFAIQHFSERETIVLFENVCKSLKKAGGGIFYCGDIPNKRNLWDYANTKEYERMYFDSIKNETPAIGTWFEKDDLVKLSEYAGFSGCEIITQPTWQINSKYRFDMKMVAR